MSNQKTIFDALPTVLPKKSNSTFVEADSFFGFLVNAGYTGRKGKAAVVEHNAMVNLIEAARYCYERPSQDWFYTTAILKVLPIHSNKHNPELACTGNQVINELKRRVKQKVNKRADLIVLWSLEFSEDFGYHYHCIFLMNGKQMKTIKSITLAIQEMRKAKEQWADMDLEICKPDKARINNQVADEYFKGYELPMWQLDKQCMRLKDAIDYQYMVFHASYAFKKESKQKILELGKRTFGGTSINTKRKMKKKASNDSVYKKVA